MSAVAAAALWAAYVVLLAVCVGQQPTNAQVSKEPLLNGERCRVPSKPPSNIEKVIASCQDEIKRTLIAEALEAFNLQDVGVFAPSDDVPLNVQDGEKLRSKRSFTEDEKRVAGCLLQCVFRRKNALNALGYPTVEGMVHLYTEGVDEKPYVLATVQAVHTCLNKVHIVVDQNEKNAPNTSVDTSPSPQAKEVGTTCEVAFNVFDCVSDKIQEYCGQSP